MKNPPFPLLRPRSILTAGLCLAVSFESAVAANKNWNNTGTDFNTGASWTGGSVPGASDTAVFATAEATNPNLSASDTIQELDFSAIAVSGYDLTSSSTSIALTLTNSGITTTTSALNASNTSGTNIIDAPIILGGAASGTQTFIQASGGTLIVNGPISSANSNVTLNLGATSGAVGLITLTGSNSYSGGTVLASGTLGIGNANALGSGSLLLNASSTVIESVNSAQTIANTISTGVNFAIGGTQNLIVTGTLLNTGGSRVITVNSTGVTKFSGGFVLTASTTAVSDQFAGSGNIVVDSTISDTASASASNLTYAGTGTLTLSGSNTFRGNLVANSGATINIQNSNALGAAGGANTVNSGAAMQLQNNISISGENLTINGAGVGGSGGALVNVADTNSFAGTISSGTVDPTITSESGLLTLSGSLAGGGKNVTFDGAGAITVGGTISGALTSVIKTGSGTTTLSVINSYTGSTVINVGTLLLNGASAINTSSGVTINGAGATFQYASTTALTKTVSFGASGGSLVYNSAATYAGAALNAATGDSIGGTGKLGAVTISSGGILNPGSGGAGTLTTGAMAWAGGGTYQWLMGNATGVQGTDWGLANVSSGGLGITANSSSTFTISIYGVSSGTTAGAIQNFNPNQSYTWTLATIAGGLTGFDPTDFSVNTSNFTNNNPASGTFSVADVDLGGGNFDINLVYTVAVPEPSTWLLIAVSASFVMFRVRRKAK